MRNDNRYFLLWSGVVCKRENGWHYIFGCGAWYLDTDSVVTDHLYGSDSSEPAGSPYAVGGMEMDGIEEISYERAMELTGGVE